MPANASASTGAKKKAMAAWDKDESLAKSLLMQKLPDSVVVMICLKKTVRERWKVVVSEYLKKSAYTKGRHVHTVHGIMLSRKGES